jgi:hypothetical protein
LAASGAVSKLDMVTSEVNIRNHNSTFLPPRQGDSGCVRAKMNDSPRIPYVLWPLAIVYGFAVAYTVNMVEKNWRGPRQRRSADWRARLS